MAELVFAELTAHHSSASHMYRATPEDMHYARFPYIRAISLNSHTALPGRDLLIATLYAYLLLRSWLAATSLYIETCISITPFVYY